jgi:hypothetical protein
MIYKQFAHPEDDLSAEERAKLNRIRLGRPSLGGEGNALV